MPSKTSPPWRCQKSCTAPPANTRPTISRPIWRARTPDRPSLSVAASRQQALQWSPNEAYSLRRSRQPALQLPGVAIPERHLASQNQHLRMVAKVEQGCRFFIDQSVNHVEATKKPRGISRGGTFLVPRGTLGTVRKSKAQRAQRRSSESSHFFAILEVVIEGYAGLIRVPQAALRI
jgi:hypothetical protein